MIRLVSFFLVLVGLAFQAGIIDHFSFMEGNLGVFFFLPLYYIQIVFL